MFSACRSIRRWRGAALACLAAAVAACSSGAVHVPKPALRVCADPNNLPFSNERQEGLENRLAALVAGEMNAAVEYAWWPQRRGFVRETLNAGTCDVVMGVPAGYDPVLTTQPYYRSTYVFLSRSDRALGIRSFDDAALRRLRVGVHLIGDDGANTPPVHALSRRGVVGNLVGFTIYGDYAEPNPPARLVDAVSSGAVDVAIVWGPLAGYFAKQSRVPLEIVPVEPDASSPALPFAYDIAMGVRRGDERLRQRLDAILEARAAAIATILDDYGVPRTGTLR
jgi:quinoprotein dehydrogenase-associated probable ABC transporter substrate-binding protein